MKKKFDHLFNLGIHDGLPVYQQHKIRFTNTLSVNFLFLALFYFIMGFVVGSFYLRLICSGLLLFGSLGLWMNGLFRYELSQGISLISVALLLFCGCNILSNGKDFAVLFLPHI